MNYALVFYRPECSSKSSKDVTLKTATDGFLEWLGGYSSVPNLVIEKEVRSIEDVETLLMHLRRGLNIY